MTPQQVADIERSATEQIRNWIATHYDTNSYDLTVIRNKASSLGAHVIAKDVELHIATTKSLPPGYRDFNFLLRITQTI